VLFNIARPQEHWTAEKVRRMYGTVEHDISLLPAQIWVHLTYQTAFVDDAGKLQIRRDVYNLDSRTLAAIKSERGIIDPDRKRAPEDAYASSRKSNSAARAAPLPRIIER
jgi:L,D-transpeptidase YcbB